MMITTFLQRIFVSINTEKNSFYSRWRRDNKFILDVIYGLLPCPGTVLSSSVESYCVDGQNKTRKTSTKVLLLLFLGITTNSPTSGRAMKCHRNKGTNEFLRGGGLLRLLPYSNMRKGKRNGCLGDNIFPKCKQTNKKGHKTRTTSYELRRSVVLKLF